MTGSQTLRAGNATALAASSRCAAPPLRSGPSGDTASAAAHGLATTGRVLPVVTDRLFHTTTTDASTMPLTSSVRVGRFRSSRAQNPSEYTLVPPSDCPTNRDHLTEHDGACLRFQIDGSQPITHGPDRPIAARFSEDPVRSRDHQCPPTLVMHPPGVRVFRIARVFQCSFTIRRLQHRIVLDQRGHGFRRTEKLAVWCTSALRSLLNVVIRKLDCYAHTARSLD